MAKSPNECAEQAARAHTDLTVFAALEILTEGSLCTPEAEDDLRRIRSVCRAAQQTALRRYDGALAALANQPPEVGQ